MKLLLAVISSDDVNEVAEKLLKNLIPSSKISHVRSFLSSYTSTLIIPCEDDQVEPALDILEEVCSPRKRQVVNSNFGDTLINDAEEGGGAVIVMDIDRFIRL